MATRNDVFVSALVEGLARSGVRDVCISPGSRNTPLSLAFAAHPDIRDWSHHDERSGAFFALGVAVTTGAPVAIVTTSGTAAAELHPAILEARATATPLVVITADRPTELHDVAAPQTVDQRNLFGTAVGWHHDLDVPDPTDAGPRVTAALAARMVAESRTGPVHLNVRFREPLLVEPAFDGIPLPLVVAGTASPHPDAIAAAGRLMAGRRGVIVAGPSRLPGLATAATKLAESLGWPILADPISGVRAGEHPMDRVVGSDLLAASGALEHLTPEAVVRVGAPPTSKSLRAWLARSEVPQIVVSRDGWPDPDAAATLFVHADPVITLGALAEHGVTATRWEDRWVALDRTLAATAHRLIEDHGFPSEPGVAAALARSAPAGARIWSASSMPIRDLDAFFPPTPGDLGLYGNRGANGIDGLVSTALGTAATGVPTVAHVGDLSMLHDVGSLATAARLSAPITVLVVNNDGGGIFSFLPQAGHPSFERHFGTPHGLSFRDIGEAFGLDSVLITADDELDTAIAETASGPRLVEVVTDRQENLALHLRIGEATRAAVAAAAV